MGTVRKTGAWERAYRSVWRREEKFLRRYEAPGRNALERKIKERVPEKLMETLLAAFVKAFGFVNNLKQWRKRIFQEDTCE